jgi:hypothetical protein
LKKPFIQHSERKREILRKIAPDLSEGKTCIKEDIRGQQSPGYSEKDKNALASSECNLLGWYR